MPRGEPTTAFRRVRELFEHALDLPAEERTAFLDERCGEGDGSVRAEVEELLALDEVESGVSDLLDRGAERYVDRAGLDLGGRIGDYELQEVLGSGGMGTVYAAQQSEPRRRVALKVLSLALANDQAARRFRWEAEVLARLQHPGIAQVFAVGVHGAGRIELPWFAMELVPDALDLVSYADEHGLDQRARLELLLQVCDAVHHGHLHGVVHRDLKPQNVLVDSHGRAKVIDFGIARSMAQDTPAVSMTDGGVVLGTLHYMSPEQLRGQAVDLRSDIYSLAVVAFELLAGRRPFMFDETTPLAVAKTVENQQAPRLSTVLKGADRDLEVVLQKALRRDPNERYSAVAEFADDLRAFLDNRPVRARAPSTLYQLRMFARRRRGLVGSLIVIAAFATVALAVVLWQNRELARRERVAQRVAQFARDFLAESALMRTKGVDYTVREALDEAAAALERERFESPAIEAELRQLVGDTYRSLSAPVIAERHLLRARTLWLEAEGAHSTNAIDTSIALVVALREQNRVADARRLLDDSKATLTEAQNAAELADDPRWWKLQFHDAYLMRHEGRLDEANALLHEVVAARERLLGPDAEATIVAMHSLGLLLLMQYDNEAARDMLTDAVDRADRSDHPPASRWQIADSLGEAWLAVGEIDRAIARHREAYTAFEELAGPDHQVTLGAAYHLLKALHHKGDRGELEEVARTMLPRCERTFGADDPRTMDVLQALAVARLQAGDFDAAIAHMERAYATNRRVKGRAHPGTFSTAHNLMHALLTGERPARALEASNEMLAALDDTATAEQLPRGTVGITWLLRARALAATDSPEARTAADRATAILTADLTAEHPLAQQAKALAAELAAR